MTLNPICQATYVDKSVKLFFVQILMQFVVHFFVQMFRAVLWLKMILKWTGRDIIYPLQIPFSLICVHIQSRTSLVIARPTTELGTNYRVQTVVYIGEVVKFDGL